LAIVKRHLVGGEAISAICDELGLQPTQVYTWEKQLFENGAGAFERSRRNDKADSAKDRKIEALESKLANKNEVIAELMEENVKAKKANGEL
jgi:transposase-like protein